MSSNLSPSKAYTLVFQIAAVVIPVAMTIAAATWGDMQPIVRDICGVMLKSTIVVPQAEPSYPADAGAAR